jgi:hypothetical protein
MTRELLRKNFPKLASNAVYANLFNLLVYERGEQLLARTVKGRKNIAYWHLVGFVARATVQKNRLFVSLTPQDFCNGTAQGDFVTVGSGYSERTFHRAIKPLCEQNILIRITIRGERGFYYALNLPLAMELLNIRIHKPPTEEEMLMNDRSKVLEYWKASKKLYKKTVESDGYKRLKRYLRQFI